MQPTLQVLAQLNATADLRAGDARQAFIGVCRDLRGVAQVRWADWLHVRK